MVQINCVVSAEKLADEMFETTAMELAEHWMDLLDAGQSRKYKQLIKDFPRGWDYVVA